MHSEQEDGEGRRSAARRRNVLSVHPAAERRGRRRGSEASPELQVRLAATVAATAEAVVHATSPQELFDAVCRVLVEHGGFRLVWVGLVDRDSGEVGKVAEAGVARRYLEAARITTSASAEGRGPTGVALRTGRPDVCNDIAFDGRMAPWRPAAVAAGLRASAALPLVVDGRVAGVLSLYAEAPGSFDGWSMAALERLVANVAHGWRDIEHDEGRRDRHEGSDGGSRLGQRFAQSGVASMLIGLDNRITLVNRAMCDLLARSPEELVGTFALDLVHPDERGSAERTIEAVTAATDVSFQVTERRLLRSDGDFVWAIVSSTLVRDDDGAGRELFVQMQDITNRRRAEELAARRGCQQAALAELGRTALAEHDLDALFCRAVELIASLASVQIVDLLELDEGGRSLARRAATGFECGLLAEAPRTVGLDSLAGRALGASATTVVVDLYEDGHFPASALLRSHGVRSSIVAVVDAGGRPFGVLEAHATSSREFDEDEVPLLESVANVLGAAIARRDVEIEMRRRALHDALTGLPNRARLRERLEHTLGRRAWLAGELAVLFVDLDRFKVVNDSLGHVAGDELLIRSAERIVEVVGPEDLVARFGGDEFVVVCEGVGGVEHTLEVAERVLASLAVPVVLGGQELASSASVGVAVSDSSTDQPDDLLRNADIAMYRAKAAGGACAVVFDTAMRLQLRERLQLETELRRAVERGQLVVYYQPVIEIASGAIVGAEALVRWQHPMRGLVLPAAFIPVAEETGLIEPIGKLVMERACADVARWMGTGREAALELGVNVSARQLRSPAFASSVAAALEATGLAPATVRLEITESVLMEDTRTTQSALEALKSLGVRLAVDDFGTGYSSLGYLKRFPIDELKVDRSFVSGLGRAGPEEAIVAGVVQLARALDLGVVAEGVETEAQLAHLREIGCERAQGFLMSRALPAAHFERLLITERSS